VLLFSWSRLECFPDPGVLRATGVDGPPHVPGVGLCVCVCVHALAHAGMVRPRQQLWVAKQVGEQPGTPSWALWEPGAVVAPGLWLDCSAELFSKGAPGGA
jgi:hypothetical protein